MNISTWRGVKGGGVWDGRLSFQEVVGEPPLICSCARASDNAFGPSGTTAVASAIASLTSLRAIDLRSAPIYIYKVAPTVLQGDETLRHMLTRNMLVSV